MSRGAWRGSGLGFEAILHTEANDAQKLAAALALLSVNDILLHEFGCADRLRPGERAARVERAADAWAWLSTPARSDRWFWTLAPSGWTANTVRGYFLRGLDAQRTRLRGVAAEDAERELDAA